MNRKTLLAIVLLIQLSIACQAKVMGTVRPKRDWCVRMGHIDTNFVTPQVFLENLKLGMMPACPQTENAIIVEYSISWMQKGEKVYHTPFVIKNSSKMPDDIYEQSKIANIKPGDTIFIENIQVKMPQDGKVRKLNSMIITII